MQVKKGCANPAASHQNRGNPFSTCSLRSSGLHQSSLPSDLASDRRLIMQDMSVQATVPGGQQMVVNIGGQQMQVMVPMGVQPGQNFTFSVPAPQQPAMAMAQPMMAPPMMQPAVAMGQPVMPQPPISPMMAQPQQVIMIPAGVGPNPARHGRLQRAAGRAARRLLGVSESLRREHARRDHHRRHPLHARRLLRPVLQMRS